MSIRDLDTYVEQLWDWGFLDDCFSGKIKITDIDGLVERKGNFLLIEAKSSGKWIPVGQQILFDNLILSDRWHVLILWGEPNEPEKMQLWGHHEYPQLATEEDVKNVVRRWFSYANRNPAPSPQDS